LQNTEAEARHVDLDQIFFKFLEELTEAIERHRTLPSAGGGGVRGRLRKLRKPSHFIAGRGQQSTAGTWLSVAGVER
jgi:hypothetical protein